MDNAAIVEQIVQSLSFEVEAVPQDNVIELSTTSKSAPLNVKIRVRKNDETGLKYGVISLPPRPSRPNNAPERLRLVSSDQTIMSFNVIMEADFGKPKKKTRKNILAIFKPSCLGVKNDDDDNEGEIDEESASHSDGAIKAMAVHRDERYRDIFGKCKPGGCLDPPFSEDREPYCPATKNEAVQDKIWLRTVRNSVQNKPQSSSIFSYKLLSWNRKKNHEETYDSNEERIKKKRDTKTNSNLDLLQTGSLQTSVTYSNSIITYPDTVNSSDLQIQENKARVADICFDTSKNSFNEHSGHFFVPGFAPIKLKKSEEQNDTNMREENSHKIKTVYSRSKAEQNEIAMKEDNGGKTKVEIVNTTHTAGYDTAMKNDKGGGTEMKTDNPRPKAEQTDTGIKEVKNGIKNNDKGSLNMDIFYSKPKAESTRSQDFKLDGGKDIPRKDYVADIRDLEKHSYQSADLPTQKKSNESNLEKVTLQDSKNQISNNDTPLDILYTPKNNLTRKDEEQTIVKKIVVTSTSDKNLNLIKPAGFEHLQLHADTKSNTEEGIDNTQKIINLINKGQFSYLRESTDGQQTSIDSIQAKRRSDISNDFSQELPNKEYVENESYLRSVITNKKKSKDFVNPNTKKLINDFRNPDKIVHRNTKYSDERNITIPTDKNSIGQINHVDKTEFVKDSSSDVKPEFTAQPDEILSFSNAVIRMEAVQENPLSSSPISLYKDALRREINDKQPEDKSKNTVDDKHAMAERFLIPDIQITTTLNESSDYRLYETQNDLKLDIFDANIKKINKIPDDETNKHKGLHDREKSKQSTNSDMSPYDADVKNTFASSTEQDRKDDSKNQEFDSSSKPKYPELDFLSPKSLPLEKGSVTKADDEIIDLKRTGIDTEVLNYDLEQIEAISDEESTDQTVDQMKPHVKHKKIYDVNDAELPFEDNTIASTTGQDEIDNLKNQQSENMPKYFDSGSSLPKSQAIEKGTASKPGDERVDFVRPSNDKHDSNYNLKQLEALDDVEPTVQTLYQINSDDKQVTLFIENDAEQPYGDNTSENTLATATEQDEIDYLRNREFDELKYSESDSLSSKSRTLDKHHVMIASADKIDAARNDNDVQDLNHGLKQLKTLGDVEITDQTIDQIQPDENQLILYDENYEEQSFRNIKSKNTRVTTTEQDETDNSKNQESDSNTRPKYPELDSLSSKIQADDEIINAARTRYDTQDLYYDSKQLKALDDVKLTNQTLDQIKPDENHLLLYDENYAEQLFGDITSENALATIKERDEIDNTQNSEFDSNSKLKYPESDSVSSKSRALEKYHVMIASDKIIDAARNYNDVQDLNHGSKQSKTLGGLEITDQTIDQIQPDENQLILYDENYGEQPLGHIMSKNTGATTAEQDETDSSTNQESDSKSRPKYPGWDSLSPNSRTLKKGPGTKTDNQIYDATSTQNDTQVSHYDAEQLFGGTFTLPSVKNKTNDSYQQFLESDLNSISKYTKLDTLSQRSRAMEKGHTTKAKDGRAKAAMTSFDKQVPHYSASGVQSLKLDTAKSYKIDLALQSYQDDNNDAIIKSFDATKFPNRYPNDTVKVIECELEIGNQLSIPIGSENDLVVEIKSNRPKDVVEEPNSTCTEIVEKLRTGNDKAKSLKPNLAKDVRKILLAVYQEELLPLRNTISELQNNMQTFTSQQMILKGRVFVKAPKSSQIAPLFKRCNCMRR